MIFPEGAGCVRHIARWDERQVQPGQADIAIHVALYATRHFRRTIPVVKNRQPIAGFDDGREANDVL